MMKKKDVLILQLKYNEIINLGVSVDNLKSNFKNLFNENEIDAIFQRHDKDKDSKLSLQEFIEVILPPDYKVDPVLIEKYYRKPGGK